MLRQLSLHKLITPLVVSFLLNLPLTSHSEELQQANPEALRTDIAPKKLSKLRFLSRKICGKLNRSNEEFASQSKNIIRSFMKKFENIDNASDEEMLAYLNKNRAYLFCTLPFDRGLVHYMVYAMDKNSISKLFTWFLNDLVSWDYLPGNNTISGLTPTGRQLHPEINVIVGYSPTRQPETFLDYMQREMDDPTRPADFKGGTYAKISEFRRMYKAKHFHELSQAEQSNLLAAWKHSGVEDEVEIPKSYAE